MVNFLSNSSLRLALYPTDWSSEHFCVDKYVSFPLCVDNIVINLHFRVTANVKLVDLENVVIVNLTSTQHLPIHKYDLHHPPEQLTRACKYFLDLTITAASRASVSATPSPSCADTRPATTTTLPSAQTFCLRHLTPLICCPLLFRG